MSLPRNDPRHGTANGYNNLGCRCSRCRDAWRVYHRESLHRLGIKAPLADVIADRQRAAWAKPCGTETKYQRGCRCDECTEASRVARSSRRARTAAA